MKKSKTIKEFYFRDADIIEQLNVELPINVKYLENLINRIYKRYPLIDKLEISVIVKAVFEALRELLVSGCIMNFNKFLFDMKLLFFKKEHWPSVKVKLTPAPTIRKNND